MSLKIDIEPLSDAAGSALLVRVSGELDATTAPQLTSEINKSFDATRKSLVIDCAGIGFMNSTALGHLIAYRKLALSRGGCVALVALQARTREVLDLLGALDLFVAVDTLQGALSAIGHRGATGEPLSGTAGRP
ncbi:MAG: STAS domain-containing protein [Candidatus Schekmanbacteria bacterium]|nr:STAS domain-containing protein [Candidatus Schekmanbacteria bacterium]